MSIMKLERDELAQWPAVMAVSRAPEVVLAEAHEAAKALKRVIDAKPKKVQFGGETYLEMEDWSTVGRFYGIAPRVVTTKYVEYGGITGWEATADAVHVESGKVVSSADAMCLTDEEHWRSRPKYEWHYVKKSGGTSAEDPGKDELIWEKGNDGRNRPKKLKVQMPDEAVPMFQLRSMAQTRASAKALRNALSWVVVLAGYRPTPAEEMTARPDPPRESAAVTVIDSSRPEPDTGKSAEELFETPTEERERLATQGTDASILLGRIEARWAKLRTPAKVQTQQWERHLGATPFLSAEADPAALNDLLGTLGEKL